MAWKKELVETVHFCMPGKVIGKQRPRMTRSGRVYTPAETERREREIARAFKAQFGDKYSVWMDEVHMSITFSKRIPPSKPRKMFREPNTFKPDIDNAEKLILDALNGVAYHDDSQITMLVAYKKPREMDERTDIEIYYYRNTPFREESN